MPNTFDAKWFAERLSNRNLRGIALETGALIRSGILPAGTKLPPLRDLAFELGISPATLSQAWSGLRKHGIIGGLGRNGSWVMHDRFAAKPERLMSIRDFGGLILNLAIAEPDRALLPDLASALAHGARADGINSYERVRILPELEAAVRPFWPYNPAAFLATSGGYNAIYTLLHALIPPGMPVAIEDPTALRLLDILEDLNVPILSVACDKDGPLPDSLARATAQRPAAFLFQPRVHCVTGICVSESRLQALGDVLAKSDALIIEDDGIGDVSTTPRMSLGGRFGERVIHIHSFSKSHGPDLRLAVLSSSATIVEQIQSYRSFSAGWTSRILQSAAAWLLQDANTGTTLKRAHGVYRRRRETFAEELLKRNVGINAGFGLSVLVPVASEPRALAILATKGIAVGAGAKFTTHAINAIRVATSILREEDAAMVAQSIALAVG